MNKIKSVPEQREWRRLLLFLSSFCCRMRLLRLQILVFRQMSPLYFSKFPVSFHRLCPFVLVLVFQSDQLLATKSTMIRHCHHRPFRLGRCRHRQWPKMCRCEVVECCVGGLLTPMPPNFPFPDCFDFASSFALSFICFFASIICDSLIAIQTYNDS